MNPLRIKPKNYVVRNNFTKNNFEISSVTSRLDRKNESDGQRDKTSLRPGMFHVLKLSLQCVCVCE